MKDNYILDTPAGRPRMELTVQLENKRKKIIFDDGNPQVPPALIEFQKLIERTLDIKN
jgi:hypothetical protein